MTRGWPLGLALACQQEPRFLQKPPDSASAPVTESGTLRPPTGETGRTVGPTDTTRRDTGGEETGLPPETGTPPPPEVDFRVGAPRPCSDPSLRESQPFDPLTLPAGPARSPLHFEGGGMVVADFDGDGWEDLLLAHAPPELWRSVDEGRRFERVEGALDGIDLSGLVGGAAADVDGDGDLDAALTRYGLSNVLLLNDGTGRFRDGSARAGWSATTGRGTTVAFSDLDRDGDVDVFVGKYGEPPADGDTPDLPPGDPSELWLNRGDGTFEDASRSLPREVQEAYSFQAGFYDMNLDGWPDLLSVHDYGQFRSSVYLQNDQRGGLVLTDGTGFHPLYNGMGLGVGDLSGDGRPDLVQTSLRDISLLLSSDAPTPAGFLMVEWAQARSLDLNWGTASIKGQDVGWGAEMGDVDNDADLDIALAFGLWNYHLLPIKVEEHDGLWLQDEAGLFDDVAPAWRINDGFSTRGLLLVDLDHDGWLDQVRRPVNADTRLDLARCGAASWLEVELRQRQEANTSAVGAVVDLLEPGSGALSQRRWVVAGSTSLFVGGPPVAHFGLGEQVDPVLVRITWPDGRQDQQLLPVHQRTLVERLR